MRRLLLVAMVLPFVAASTTRTAAHELTRRSPGFHMHDGFFLRLSAGVGYTKATEDMPESKPGWSGMGAIESIAIGGAVAPNLILECDLFDSSVITPSYTLDGKEVSNADTEVAFAAEGIGIGMTYYVMPANVYVSGAVGLGVNTIQVEENKDPKQLTGWGLNGMLGKEWWVSDNWGLGVAGQVMYFVVDDKIAERTYTIETLAFGVLFSATYN